MNDLVLSLDLGTGGCKSSLWSPEGVSVAESVVPYDTFHPHPGWNVQRPTDWWDAVRHSVRALLARDPNSAERIAGIAVSGHSLGVVALDSAGELVFDETPIWSDTRATAEAERFFEGFPEGDWYLRTGNGFDPALYPVFKSAWYAAHEPEKWARARLIVGSKDYVNYRLTGELATDHSYASGSGAYHLGTHDYDDEILSHAGLDRGLLPRIGLSTDQLGTVRDEVAADLGLPAGVVVFAGGVDNSCMALGSRCSRHGTTYASLGSSSWMNFIGANPVLNVQTRPYVFAHVVPDLYVSALSTFSSGTTMTWLKNLIAPDKDMASFISDATRDLDAQTELVFLPMLSGGTPLEGGAAARGMIYGLGLQHEGVDVTRAAIDGITLALRRSFLGMAQLTTRPQEVLISGGGSQDPGWNQIYADAFDVDVVRTGVDQQVSALGAAAIAFVGTGLWSSFDEVARAHVELERYRPNGDRARRYDRLAAWFDELVGAAIDLRKNLPPL